MRRKLLFISMLSVFISLSACNPAENETITPEVPELPESPGDEDSENNGTDTPDVSSLSMNIIIGDQIISAVMEDNSAARDLLSRLPMEVTLNDYNNTTEKIFYPDPELNLESVIRGCAPVPGDITIYAPWGNVAIFCKKWSHSSSLIKIGHIDGNGIQALSVPGDIHIKLERK